MTSVAERRLRCTIEFLRVKYVHCRQEIHLSVLVIEISDFYSMVLSSWDDLRVSKNLCPDITILHFGRTGGGFSVLWQYLNSTIKGVNKIHICMTSRRRYDIVIATQIFGSNLLPKTTSLRHGIKKKPILLISTYGPSSLQIS